MLSDLGSIHTPPIHSDASIYFDVLHTFEHPLYVWMPHILRYPHMFGCPPICLDTPCLDTPHAWMPSIYLSICMPHTPLYICMFLGGFYILYEDRGIYTPHIECSDAITRIIYKKHYKFAHVGKHKHLNKTPYDVYELFMYLS